MVTYQFFAMKVLNHNFTRNNGKTHHFYPFFPSKMATSHPGRSADRQAGHVFSAPQRRLDAGSQRRRSAGAGAAGGGAP